MSTKGDLYRVVVAACGMVGNGQKSAQAAAEAGSDGAGRDHRSYSVAIGRSNALQTNQSAAEGRPTITDFVVRWAHVVRTHKESDDYAAALDWEQSLRVGIESLEDFDGSIYHLADSEVVVRDGSARGELMFQARHVVPLTE
jgi:hypothetical protein